MKKLLIDNFEYIVFFVGAALLLLIMSPQDQEPVETPAPTYCTS